MEEMQNFLYFFKTRDNSCLEKIIFTFRTSFFQSIIYILKL